MKETVGNSYIKYFRIESTSNMTFNQNTKRIPFVESVLYKYINCETYTTLFECSSNFLMEF